MKKSILLLDVLILMVSTITSCDSTPSPTPTSLPGATLEEPEPNIYNRRNLLVVFGDISKGRFFLIDLSTGKTQGYENPNAIIDFVGLDVNSCSLLGFSNSDYMVTDIESGKSQIIYHFGLLDPKAEKPWIYPPLLSPDQKKVAYLYGRGSFYEGMSISEYEFQDLVVKDVTDISKEYRISQNRGARFSQSERLADRLALWSPDSQWIAYSDLDDTGTYQIFISRYDGSQRRQLTGRPTLKENAFDFNYSLAWSPSGARLAISYYDQFQKIEIFDIAHDNHVQTLGSGFALWWADEMKLIYRSEDLSGISLYDLSAQATTKVIDDDDGRFFLGAPFGDRYKIGYFMRDTQNPSDSEFHVYDISTSSDEVMPQVKLPSENTRYWILVQRQSCENG